MSGYTKSSLIDKITKGDEKAFRLLFDMYYQQLFHQAFYYLSSKEQAEEAVSDVFFIIWKKRETLDKIENIESYLYTSVKHQALHYIRRTNEPEKAPLDLYHIEVIPDNNNPESKLLDEEQRELIQKAINSLPEKCRKYSDCFFPINLNRKKSPLCWKYHKKQWKPILLPAIRKYMLI